MFTTLTTTTLQTPTLLLNRQRPLAAVNPARHSFQHRHDLIHLPTPHHVSHRTPSPVITKHPGPDDAITARSTSTLSPRRAIRAASPASSPGAPAAWRLPPRTTPQTKRTPPRPTMPPTQRTPPRPQTPPRAPPPRPPPTTSSPRAARTSRRPPASAPPQPAPLRHCFDVAYGATTLPRPSQRSITCA